VSGPLFSLKNRWFTGSVAALLAIAAISAAFAFVWVPRSQAAGAMASLWESICSAAGAPGRFRSEPLPLEPLGRSSNVIVSGLMMGPADSSSIGRGATLALQCTMCHGARGITQPGSPQLIGQPASAVYKQLRDYKSGHRKSVVMEPLVVELSDADMRDLAAYYSSLPRERSPLPPAPPAATPALVSNGAPARTIGACAACHATAVGKIATPVLDGQPASYLKAQMQAFIREQRRNDINGQMRNAVRRMTPGEVDAVAAYYQNR
jgi:cytochrome c553